MYEIAAQVAATQMVGERASATSAANSDSAVAIESGSVKASSS